MRKMIGCNIGVHSACYIHTEDKQGNKESGVLYNTIHLLLTAIVLHAFKNCQTGPQFCTQNLQVQ